MQRTILGIVVTTVGLFMLGFIYWGLSPMPYDSWKKTEDVAQTQQILRDTFPESGTYFIPGRLEDTELMSSLYAKGPTASIHINLEGADPADPAIMAQGFVLNLLVVSLMAGLFKVCRAKEYRDFAWISMMVGVIGVVMFDGGHIVWWQEPAGWVAWQMIYNFSALVFVGHILGIFMKEKPEAS